MLMPDWRELPRPPGVNFTEGSEGLVVDTLRGLYGTLHPHR